MFINLLLMFIVTILTKATLIKHNTMSKTDRLVIEINDNLKERFKKKVESEGRSMKYVLTQFVRDYTYDKKEIK